MSDYEERWKLASRFADIAGGSYLLGVIATGSVALILGRTGWHEDRSVMIFAVFGIVVLGGYLLQRTKERALLELDAKLAPALVRQALRLQTRNEMCRCIAVLYGGFVVLSGFGNPRIVPMLVRALLLLPSVGLFWLGDRYVRQSKALVERDAQQPSPPKVSPRGRDEDREARRAL